MEHMALTLLILVLLGKCVICISYQNRNLTLLINFIFLYLRSYCMFVVSMLLRFLYHCYKISFLFH